MYPGRVSPRVLNGLFWGLFLAIVVASFIMAPTLGYIYSPEISLATYSTVIQGLGALLAIAAAGLFMLRLKIDHTINSLEERTLGVLNNKLGWSVIRWSDDLETRMEEEFMGAAYPEVYEAQEASEDYLEKELDELLDAILVEEESAGGGQVQKEVPVAEAARPALSSDVKEVLAAIRERRALIVRRYGLSRIMGGPLAMLAALVAMSAWAIPATDTFLVGMADLNTSLIFTATYGGIIALAFTAAAGLKAALS